MNTKPKDLTWFDWQHKVVDTTSILTKKTLNQIQFKWFAPGPRAGHLIWPAAVWCWSDDEIILFTPGPRVSPSDGWVGTGPDCERVLIASRLRDFEDIIIFMDA